MPRLRKLQAALNVLTGDKLVEHTVAYTGQLRAARYRQREGVVTTKETSKQGWWSTDDPATSAKLDVNSVIAARLVAPTSGGKKTRRCPGLHHASRNRE